jgi:hypothetical protein
MPVAIQQALKNNTEADMSITSTCPGCGSSLTIDETAGEVVCPYCGTHFHVNMDDMNPGLQVEPAAPEDARPPEPSPASQEIIDVTPHAVDEAYNPPVPGQAPTPPGDFYNPPIPGSAPTPPLEMYNPPTTNYGAGQPPFPPPPSPFGAFTSRYSFLTGSRLWIAIAIVAIVVFCGSCSCLFFAVQRALR